MSGPTVPYRWLVARRPSFDPLVAEQFGGTGWVRSGEPFSVKLQPLGPDWMPPEVAIWSRARHSWLAVRYEEVFVLRFHAELVRLDCKPEAKSVDHFLRLVVLTVKGVTSRPGDIKLKV